MNLSNGGRLRFGDFELDPLKGKLLRDGRAIKIQPQPLRVLTALAERPGEIVSREDLRIRIWDDATFVEFDQGLNYCIRQIRLALEDDAAEPAYIETLPRRGYRLITPVTDNGTPSTETSGDPADSAPAALNGTAPTVSTSVLRTGSTRSRSRVWWGVAAGALVLAGSGLWIFRSAKEAPLEVAGVTQIAMFPGDKFDPAFSPDGSSIAFSWAGEKNDSPGIYVIPARGGDPRRLTQATNSDISPVWAPDGRRIAFLRRHPGQADELIVVPSNGGPEQKLRDVRMPELVRRNPRPIMAWTRDGTGVVIPLNDPENLRASFFRIGVDGAPARRILRSQAGLGYVEPAFSPDGKRFAYSDGQTIRIVRMGTGDALREVADRVLEAGRSPVWSPDGGQLLYFHGPRIMVWNSRTDRTQVLYVSPDQIQAMSARWVAPDIPEIIFSIYGGQSEIRALTLKDGRVTGSSARLPLRAASVPTLSRDGRWITFSTLPGDTGDLWMADAQGQHARQLTFAGIVDRGNWSPDGKHFAFHVTPGFTDYVLDIDPDTEIRKPEGTKPAARLVAATAFGLIAPDWSPDGRYLYATRPGDIYRIMRVPAAGGEVEDLFEGDGARVEPDRKRIYYGKQDVFGLFARSLEGDVRSNLEERIVADYVAPRGFDVNRRGVYYLGRDSARKPVAIRYFDFALRKSVDIAPAPLGPLPTIVVAADGSQLLYDTLAVSARSLTLMKFSRGTK